jgi:Protein of unknown function (DUF1501)
MYAKDSLGGAVSEGFRVRDDVYKTVEMAAADRDAISAKGFELSARRIGRLMRAQYNLGFVDVGGWDTHVGQGDAQDTSRLGSASSTALAGFAQELGPAAWRGGGDLRVRPHLSGVSAGPSEAAAWRGSRSRSSARPCSRTAITPC